MQHDDSMESSIQLQAFCWFSDTLLKLELNWLVNDTRRSFRHLALLFTVHVFPRKSRDVLSSLISPSQAKSQRSFYGWAIKESLIFYASIRDGSSYWLILNASPFCLSNQSMKFFLQFSVFKKWKVRKSTRVICSALNTKRTKC